jgi:alkanesulfonate monooxygenase SsuD/methylene tetrahydromethanopterin reductase-like flavin-dependent oxidoreductase (luciferase family)
MVLHTIQNEGWKGNLLMSAPSTGVFLPTMSPPDERPGDVVAGARHAEGLGFESVWAVDQLVAGTGAPFVESVVALAAAAGATTRVRLGLGVLILPLRPVIWVAKQVASLQQVSGGRVLLGVGAGGDRHDRSWEAAGVPRRERGRRTDAALRVLPDLVTGHAVTLEDGSDHRDAQLAPGVPMPPVLVGGMSDVALTRAARVADGAFFLPVRPELVAAGRQRLTELADEAGRPAPSITTGLLAAIDGDPDLPGRAGIVARLTDVDGMFGMHEDAVDDLLVAGSVAAVADRVGALADAGADRVVLSVAAGHWARQAELFAEACARLGWARR